MHKATHHFDLINWWLDADPVGRVGVRQAAELRQERDRSAHQLPAVSAQEQVCVSTATSPATRSSMELYVNVRVSRRLSARRLRVQGRHRHLRHDERRGAYSNGVNMSYSLNAFMPIEGYRLAFNGTKGRLEVRDYERQPWDPGEETEMHVIKNFGKRVKVEVPRETERPRRRRSAAARFDLQGIDAPAHMRLPDSRAGAMSCLTGIAARKSIDEGRPIKIADLVKFT